LTLVLPLNAQARRHARRATRNAITPSNYANQIRQKAREFILSAAKDGAVGARVFADVRRWLKYLTHSFPMFAEMFLFVFTRLEPVTYLAVLLSAMGKVFHFIWFQHKALGRIFKCLATNDDEVSK
jgi:hypothetical protein